MGIKAIGIDFDEKMCQITKDNLKVNRFTGEVYNKDFEYMNQLKFDGIVTDIPYGTASKVSEPPKKIMKKFVSKIPKKAKFAIMCKKGLDEGIKLRLTKKYEIYRHKSLTRMILIK